MLSIERQNFIENELKIHGSVLISDISAKLSCYEETVRRDLTELEKNGRLIRVHGGAYLPSDTDKGVPVKIKQTLLPEEKNKIAEIVIRDFIKEKDTIFLDSSTTCVTLAKKIIDLDIKVTIITNSLITFKIYCDSGCQNVKLIGIGGNYRERACSFVGYDTTNQISNYSADKCFLSPSAISLTLGLLDNSSNECQIRKAFIKQSREHYLISDHTKFSDTADYVICNLKQIENIITDDKLDKVWTDAFNELGIKYTYK